MINRRNQAIALRREGYSVTDISKELDVPIPTVSDWIRGIEITPEQRAEIATRKPKALINLSRKTEAQKEARRLRQEEGLSIRRIAKKLGIAQSTVSLWVRDITLTDEQLAAIKIGRYEFSTGSRKGGQTNMLKYRLLREGYQAEGREKARERDPLHVAGCMLYWAEGAKSRNYLGFANSDPEMLRFFIKFLRECLNVDNSEITISVNCYTNNGLTAEEIETYWLTLLELPRSQLRKTIINSQPRSSKQRGRKLLYGVCRLNVGRVRVLQHIFGAIQEYAGIDKPEWLQ